MHKKPLVDFIGIGVNKSATSWISTCLAEHPDICMSRPKETYFFGKNFSKGAEWFNRCFSHCKGERLRGEFTPAYIRYDESRELIKTHAPNAKLIVCLRNPVDCLASAYFFGKSRGAPRGSMHAWMLDSVDRVKYFQQLAPYIQTFGREQIQILLYDDIKKDPVHFMQTIFSFLEVDPAFRPPSAEHRVNVTSANATKILWINQILHWFRKKIKNMPGGRAATRFLQMIGVNWLVNKIFKMNRGKKEDATSKSNRIIPYEIKLSVIAAIKNDVNKLEDLLDRDLLDWLTP